MSNTTLNVYKVAIILSFYIRLGGDAIFATKMHTLGLHVLLAIFVFLSSNESLWLLLLHFYNTVVIATWFLMITLAIKIYHKSGVNTILVKPYVHRTSLFVTKLGTLRVLVLYSMGFNFFLPINIYMYILAISYVYRSKLRWNHFYL